MARRRQAVTIRHVAEDAGVSLQTVSRVINQEPNVRPEMQERVQSSIDKLGYVPSIAAQRMSGSRSYLILALNDRERTLADWRERIGVDWVDQMLLGGMETCAKHGYRMMVELVDTHSDHVERELSAAIAALQPDGARDPGPGIRMTMDDEHAAQLATERLIGLGHRRIGFIAGSEEYSLSGWRIDGWKAAMDKAGLPVENLCARGDFSFDSGLAAATELLALKPRPTAIIASSDQMALATLEVAAKLAIEVPRDLSVISFDNTPIVRYTRPPLTAVDQPIAETISQAVELLINPNKEPQPEETIDVQGCLVERGSIGPAPGANDG